MRRALVMACIWVWTALPAWAATYYVSAGGTNHSCSQATNPSTRRNSINAGIACLSSGDTLIIGDGRYRELVSDVPPAAVAPPLGTGRAALPNGTAGAYTILKAEHRRQAILTVTPQGDWLAPIELSENAHHIRFEGLVIDGQNHTTNGIAGSTHPTTLHALQFVDLQIQNILYMGVQMGGQNHQFINVDMKNIARTVDGETTCPREGYCHPYYIGGSGHVMDGGTYTNVDGWVYHQGQGPGGHVFKNSTIDTATTIANCHNSTVFNVTAKNLSWGVSMGGGCAFVHNTVTLRTRGKPGTFIYQNAGSPNLIKNNLLFNFANNPSEWDYIYIEDGQGQNLLRRGPHPNISGNVCDYRQNGCTYAPPSSCFVRDAAGGDFALCSNSPAISAGVNDASMAPFTPDQAGVARPPSGPRDAGAARKRR